MDTFIIYLVKNAIYFIAFYIGVKVFLSNETFFRFNRCVILIGSVVCLVLPLIQIKVTSAEISPLQTPIIVLEKALTEITIKSNAGSNTEIDTPKATSSLLEIDKEAEPLDIGTIILCIYVAGMIVNLAILFRSSTQMVNLIRRGSKRSYSDYILVLIPEDIIPFSWGKYIVLSVSDYKNSPDEIITHEIAHTRHRHSLDLIFMELVLLLQWFNPAIWLLKRELKNIHEYQADISVLQSGINATKYQLLLVKKAVGASSYTLANSFNHSKIKKRITMMLKEKSNKWARVKLILLLPLGTLTVLAFARPEVNKPLTTLIEYESTNILQDMKTSEKEVIAFTTPVVKPDTTPKRKVVFVPPPPVKTTKQSGEKKTVRFTPPTIVGDPASYGINISSKKVGDVVTDSIGRKWKIISKSPNKIRFIHPPTKTKPNQSDTTATKKKTVKFVPPVIKKD